MLAGELPFVWDEMEEDELEVVAVELLVVEGVVELMGGVVEWLELALLPPVLQAMMTAKTKAMMTASLDLLLPSFHPTP